MPCLFAEQELPTWVVVVITLGSATFLGGLWKIYKDWDDHRSKKRRSSDDRDEATRRDANLELGKLLDQERENRKEDVLRLQAERLDDNRRCKEDLDKLMVKLDKQDSYVKSLIDRAGKAETDAAKKDGRITQLEMEIQHVTAELREVSAMTGRLPAGVTLPCQIIADNKGIIKWASGSSMDMFGWLPQELIGRTVTVLMSPEYAPLHKRALELLVKDGKKLDPAKLIRGKGITKLGRAFPVQVHLSAAEGLSPGVIYITAEIKRYGDSDAYVTAKPPSSPDLPALEDTVKAPKSEK